MNTIKQLMNQIKLANLNEQCVLETKLSTLLKIENIMVSHETGSIILETVNYDCNLQYSDSFSDALEHISRTSPPMDDCPDELSRLKIAIKAIIASH